MLAVVHKYIKFLGLLVHNARKSRSSAVLSTAPLTLLESDKKHDLEQWKGVCGAVLSSQYGILCSHATMHSYRTSAMPGDSRTLFDSLVKSVNVTFPGPRRFPDVLCAFSQRHDSNASNLLTVLATHTSHITVFTQIRWSG